MHHKAGSLNDDDEASICVHGEDFMVESRIVFQDAKAMLEHKVDINVISIIGLGHGTEAKIVKRALTWSPAGYTWKVNPKHARDLITWTGLDPSKSAAPRKSYPGIVPKPCHRREALQPISHWIGRTLPSASVKQIKTLQNRKCEPKRD